MTITGNDPRSGAVMYLAENSGFIVWTIDPRAAVKYWDIDRAKSVMNFAKTMIKCGELLLIDNLHIEKGGI